MAESCKSKAKNKPKAETKATNCDLCREKCRLDGNAKPKHSFQVGQSVIVQKTLKRLPEGTKGKVVGVCRKPLGTGARYKRRANYLLVETDQGKDWINFRNLKATA
jgi:hypothetical protein